jgi:hypothetical protein
MMEEIKQKVQDLEMALNYVCYDATLIPKLQTVWGKLELLQEAVNKNCNTPDVSVCTCALESTDVYDDEGNYLGYVCLGCGYFSKY